MARGAEERVWGRRGGRGAGDGRAQRGRNGGGKKGVTGRAATGAGGSVLRSWRDGVALSRGHARVAGALPATRLASFLGVARSGAAGRAPKTFLALRALARRQRPASAISII